MPYEIRILFNDKSKDLLNINLSIFLYTITSIFINAINN